MTWLSAETWQRLPHKHREELEKITPDMLEAEVVAACRLLEEKQHFSDNLDESVAVYRGKGLYQVGNESIRLDGYQADVLETLVELRAATFEQLQRKRLRQSICCPDRDS